MSIHTCIPSTPLARSNGPGVACRCNTTLGAVFSRWLADLFCGLTVSLCAQPGGPTAGSRPRCTPCSERRRPTGQAARGGAFRCRSFTRPISTAWSRRSTSNRASSRSTARPGRRQEFCHSAAPPSHFSRCFNRDGERASAKWQNSRRWLGPTSPSQKLLASLGLQVLTPLPPLRRPTPLQPQPSPRSAAASVRARRQALF